MADAADKQPEAKGQPVSEAAPRPRRLKKIKLCDLGDSSYEMRKGSQEEIEGDDERSQNSSAEKETGQKGRQPGRG